MKDFFKKFVSEKKKKKQQTTKKNEKLPSRQGFNDKQVYLESEDKIKKIIYIRIFFSTFWKIIITVGGFVNQLIKKFWPKSKGTVLGCICFIVYTAFT